MGIQAHCNAFQFNWVIRKVNVNSSQKISQWNWRDNKSNTEVECTVMTTVLTAILGFMLYVIFRGKMGIKNVFCFFVSTWNQKMERFKGVWIYLWATLQCVSCGSTSASSIFSKHPRLKHCDLNGHNFMVQPRGVSRSQLIFMSASKVGKCTFLARLHEFDQLLQ